MIERRLNARSSVGGRCLCRRVRGVAKDGRYAFVVEPDGSTTGSQEGSETIAVGQSVRVIDFKSLTVGQFDREGMKRTTFAERFDEGLKSLDGHDCLSVIYGRWKYKSQCRQCGMMSSFSGDSCAIFRRGSLPIGLAEIFDQQETDDRW